MQLSCIFEKKHHIANRYNICLSLMLSSFIFVHCHLEWLCKMTFMVTVGATLACGTGACAVVVAAVLEG